MSRFSTTFGCALIILCSRQGLSSEIGIGDYQKVIASNGEYTSEIANPFQWMADNLLEAKGSNLAKAFLEARQMDLDGDRKNELIITSSLIVGHGHTPNYVFKLTETGDSYRYIGELAVNGGRIGTIVDSNGQRLVVTTGYTGKFSLAYHENDGKRYVLKKTDEYKIQDGVIVGLPDEIRRMFPYLDPGQ